MGPLDSTTLIWAHAAAVVWLFALLIMTVLRERRAEGIEDFANCFALLIVWMLARMATLMMANEPHYLIASKLQFAALLFAIVGIFGMCRRMLAVQPGVLEFTNVLTVVGLALAVVLTDWFVVGAVQHVWGYEPIYGPPMIILLAWGLLLVVVTLLRIIPRLRAERHGTRECQRLRAILIVLGAFVLALLVELFPEMGLPVPPLSWLLVPAGMTAMVLVIWRNGLTTINGDTPLSQVVSQFQGGLLLIDNDGIVRVANPAALALLGKPEREVLRNDFASLTDCDVPADQLAARFDAGQDPESRIVAVDSGRYAKRELRMVCSPVFSGQLRGLACRIQDLSHEQRERDYAVTRELLSPDTGLPTLKVLEAALARRDVDERQPAVGVLLVRQTERSALLQSHGHTAATAMAQHMAELLSDLRSGQATLHAMPGGGFAFLLREDEAGIEQSLAGLEAQIGDALQKPLLLAAEQLPVRYALSQWQHAQGIPDAVDSFARWLRTQQFAANSTQAFAAGGISADDVQQALVGGQFLPLYAPIVDLRTGRAVGLQPYITWAHPTLGPLSMGAFAHLLTQAGLYVDVHNAVLQQALNDLRGFKQVLGDESMTLNIRPDSVALATYVSESGVDMVINALGDMARQIVMTLTPSLPLDGVLVSAMNRLRDEGMQLELREFGLGNPSMAHVARLPLSGARITRELYAASGDAKVQGRAVAAVVAAASSLGLYCAADEVETVEQMRLLSSAGCRYATGPLFGEPLDAEMILATLLSPGLLEFIKR